MKSILQKAALLIAFTTPAAIAAEEIKYIDFAEIVMRIEGLPDFKDKKSVDTFLSNLRSDTMPQLRRLHECLQKARFVTESYADLKKYGYGKTESGNTLVIDSKPELGAQYRYDTNILRNFASLKSVQDSAMKSIEEFHEFMKLPDNPSIEQIKSRLNSVDAKAAALSNRIAQATIKEDGFLFLLSQATDLLEKTSRENLPDINHVLGDGCKEIPLRPAVEYISYDLVLMAKGINEMQATVLQIRASRSKMVKYLHNYYRYKLTTAYYQAIGEDLSDLKDKILSVFATARLVEDMNGWWQRELTKGLADRYHTYYSQYEEPLRRLRATREKAQQYLEKIETYKDAPESMKSVYRQQALNILGIIDRNIDKLIKSGWQGQFEQQKSMLQFMMEYKDDYVDSCLPLLVDYNSYAEKVRSLEDFRIAEKKYAILIDSCVNKGVR